MSEKLPTIEDLEEEMRNPVSGVLVNVDGDFLRNLRKSDMDHIDATGYLPCIPDTNPETGEWMCGICHQPRETDCIEGAHKVTARSDR